MTGIMHLLVAAAAIVLSLAFALVGVSRIGAWAIERRNPPVGAFAELDGTVLHHVHVPANGEADLPPLVFIHGASGNLKDQMLPLRPPLEGRAEMLFFDRPGHGWSRRSTGNDTPAAQAGAIAALMRKLGIGPAIVVGHSFGGSVAAALALDHPESVRGLVFLSAATHPWPGGDTSWYYDLAARPLLGRLFSETLAWPAARMRLKAATDCVFSPNAAPVNYLTEASIELLLRPRAFRANAVDVAGLYQHVRFAAPRYGEIVAPAVVISGDRDTVVYEEIHSEGLARDIPGAELVWVRNLGHKPEWIAPDLVVAAIEKVAGLERDLPGLVRAVEARIAADAFGPVERCPDPKAPEAAPELP